MENRFVLNSVVLIDLVILTSGWQFFASLSDFKLYGATPEAEHLHSEYFFGECRRKDKKFLTHVYLDHIDILGKLIVRGWIDVPRIPTCMILRGTTYQEHLFRATAYNFQMCVPRITYCHTGHRFRYYYYEWYIPVDMEGGMNWDIFFYGPTELSWQ
ncbi:hypothetical protein K1T71_001781 [Dendrolimus kikuchii]|uniref:Uncharacterized protein n=1 Tax=Dendrolimus kikuchii TaxID=765133 RepID=A0ACC1DFM0_9NEOP|nr:hypothetical protein K1T71_001781 [Dendrolimus kikuchii]